MKQLKLVSVPSIVNPYTSPVLSFGGNNVPIPFLHRLFIVLYLSISIAVLTARAFQKRSRTQQLTLCRSLCTHWSATGNCKWRTCPKSLHFLSNPFRPIHDTVHWSTCTCLSLYEVDGCLWKYAITNFLYVSKWYSVRTRIWQIVHPNIWIYYPVENVYPVIPYMKYSYTVTCLFLMGNFDAFKCGSIWKIDAWGT